MRISAGGVGGESDVYPAAIGLNGAWSWHPKFLAGQASVTVGGSFCQECCTDSPPKKKKNLSEGGSESERQTRRAKAGKGNGKRAIHSKKPEKGRDERP